MAFRSIAQMEKFKQLVNEGKLSKQTYDEWNKGTIVDSLPKRIGKDSPKPTEHVKAKRQVRKQRKQRTKPKTRTQRTKRAMPKKRTMPK